MARIFIKPGVTRLVLDEVRKSFKVARQGDLLVYDAPYVGRVVADPKDLDFLQEEGIDAEPGELSPGDLLLVWDRGDVAPVYEVF